MSSAKNSYLVQQLVTKMKNPDADLRFMALTDLIADIARSGDQFGVDEATEHSTVEQVLALMNDLNGEVKNLAVKALAALVKRVSESKMQTIIDRLVAFTNSKDEGVRDIASLGLKTVVAEITPATPLATTVCTKLAPKVVEQLASVRLVSLLSSLFLVLTLLPPLNLQANSSSELQIDSLDLISEILTRFESTVRTLPALQASILQAGTPLLSNNRPAVRKRAVGALAVLIASSEGSLFTTLITSVVLPSLKGKDAEKLKTAVSLVGALAKTAPSRMGRKVKDIAPLVLKASASEDDELREGTLQALESLVLKCPTEIGSFITAIVELGVHLLKYDPNYALDEADEDGDAEMSGESDEEEEEADEDDDFGDEYSDDDDTSWKVRRAATKLLSACVSTRSDLLSTFYLTISPALIARFGEREETVKVEIWATYTALLLQTKVWGSGSQSNVSSPGRLKRKRSVDGMETDEGPLSLLSAQTSSIAKSIIKQLSAKSLGTRQAGFVLLYELVSLLEGGLDAHIPALVAQIKASLKVSDRGLSGAATTLKIEVLRFLALFFRTHHAKIFQDELEKLVPLLVSAIGDKFNKIAAEAFTTATDLVKVLRPVFPSASSISPSIAARIQSIYSATMKRLASSDADEEIKGKGIVCLGALLFHTGDLLAPEFTTSLGYLHERLRHEVSRLVAVQVIGGVAESPVCAGPVFDAWVQQCVIEVSALLRKVHRPLKVAAFKCVASLLECAGRRQSGLPVESSTALIADLGPLVDDADINLLPSALNILATLLAKSPSCMNQVVTSILPRAYELVRSPLLQGPSLEALLVFFSVLVKAGSDPSQIVQTLNETAEFAKKSVGTAGAQGGMQSLATASRCIGVVLKEAPQIAESVVEDCSATIQNSKTSTSTLILGLLTLAEVGRVADFHAHAETFSKTIELFSASSEDVRRSAAFAAGNIAVGNASAFLPDILALIQGDDKKRYLALQALKEVITHSPSATLATISDSLWIPLFENCQSQEEGTRNVAAECLGQLTVTNPSKYLPQLQQRLSSDSPHTRATVIAAIRFTFTNDSTTYDELLAPLIVEFFKLIHDPDLRVRRLALSSLNSAAHNKPHLVREHLATLLPELYGQTVVDESLIRIVEMGPFKHKVDDGLDIRKTAYECMHTLFDTCLKDIDIHEYLRRVLGGLTDEEEVKKLCYLMLVKLAEVAPTAVTQRLDDSVEAFTETLQTTLKDNAVKQETERLAELQKAALRCLASLQRLASPAATPKFSGMITNVILPSKMANDYKDLVHASSSANARLVSIGGIADVEMDLA